MPAAKKLSEKQFTQIARVLAEPRRYDMLKQIGAAGPAVRCSALHVKEEISPATISHHLKELESAGLIAVERDGKFVNLSLRRDVWTAYLDRLAEI